MSLDLFADNFTRFVIQTMKSHFINDRL